MLPILTRFLTYLVSPILLFVAASTIAHGQSSEHPASHLPIPKSHLTASEIKQAVELGADEAANMRALTASALSIGNVTVLSRVESVDDNAPGSRLALVTSYNYNRNVTIRRLVDLNKNMVVHEKITDGSSAPLAKLERTFVEQLVLEDQRITSHLGEFKDQVTVEMLLTTTQNPEDPFHQKRVVSVLLKVKQGYLVNLPSIYVSLSDAKVFVEENSR